MTPGSTNGSVTGPALVCNVLKERKKCGELVGGNRVNAYEKCLRDPSYKPDPEEDEIDEEEEEFYFTISKTTQEDTFSIPISHLRFQGDFLFHNIEVADMIARFEYGNCSLCLGDRDVDIYLYEQRERASFFCRAVLSHGNCGHGATCPLCIGAGYTKEYLRVNCSKDVDRYSDDEEEQEEEETEEEKMAKKKLRKQIQERYRDLGYGRWGYE